MTLREAIESGKPFRRKHYNWWYDPDQEALFVKIEVLAEDWEILEEADKEAEIENVQ